MMLRIIVTVVVFIVVQMMMKDDDLCKVPYLNDYYCTYYLSNVECVC